MKIKDILRISLGIVLVVIGFIGGIIPIFQGWVFGIPGLIILSNYFPRLKRVLKKIKRKEKKITSDDTPGDQDQQPQRYQDR